MVDQKMIPRSAFVDLFLEALGWDARKGAGSTRICPTTRIESPPVGREWLACGGRLRDGGCGV